MADGTLKVGTITTSSGSGTITLGQSGETIALGATTNNLSTPSFLASNNSGASLSAGTWTKLNFNSEVFDTNSAYDATNSKFVVPSGNAGKYLIGYNWRTDTLSGQTRIVGSIKVNDAYSIYFETFDGASTFTAGGVCVSGIFDLSVGDYVECFGYCNVAATQIANIADNDQRFWGMRIG